MESSLTLYHSTLASALGTIKFEYLDAYEDVLARHSEFDAERCTEEKQIVLILLSHALLEALINAYLSWKLDTKGFAAAEKKRLISKWEDEPRKFLAAYQVPQNLRLSLENLNERRN